MGASPTKMLLLKAADSGNVVVVKEILEDQVSQGDLFCGCVGDAGGSKSRSNFRRPSSSVASTMFVNSTDEYGWTASHFAARKGHVEVLRILLKYGADVNLQDHLGRTPAFFAIENDRRETLAILIENKANLMLMTKQGHSLAFVAAEYARSECLEMLLHHADIEVVIKSAKDGSTPLDVVTCHKCKDLMKHSIKVKHADSHKEAWQAVPHGETWYWWNTLTNETTAAGADRPDE